jgi:hypothetical protein
MVIFVWCPDDPWLIDFIALLMLNIVDIVHTNVHPRFSHGKGRRKDATRTRESWSGIGTSTIRGNGRAASLRQWTECIMHTNSILLIRIGTPPILEGHGSRVLRIHPVNTLDGMA